ncbi:hypothetical protein T310_0051 [Rasamsonia emersonii CBS 393.64]|uniref:Uncharacterized protein n=1 Tax=Rasamsonia emersonii (strain ATCC 16479 / CBS 393.64 / IMI 116815) TaxID=1408163 RepID=A0A0F4Z7L7_RASE3|nr:hypothetical protein T310_0051 [Rasamsonia emersonii CBS 393.64]KKA25848.1 hypothetical protein T310_0051 [Rasamsonia emersonii CBS 393.64]
MPRLVRRQPLFERIKAYLNPLDFLLWVSEEIDSSDWDQLEKDWAVPLGIGLNVVFLIARANSGRRVSRAEDDIFGDDSGGVSWVNWFVASPPMSSSPLRYLSNVLSGETAESRRHPDPQRDVWEIAVWDPFPLSLRLFCSFSPGHILIYWLFLPILPSDPRPSVTVVTTIVLVTLLTVQMSFLSSSFARQAKDNTLVHKEVLHEYDTKFVQPRMHPLMRDVGVQFSEEHAHHPGSDMKYNEVELHTPTHVINRGFKTSPNPNYIGHVDPDSASKPIFSPTRRQSFFMPSPGPAQQSGTQTPSHLRDSSPLVQAPGSIRQPQFRPPTTGSGDGGSLGVYSHANSPLRKSASVNFDSRNQHTGDFNFRDRISSPVKRQSSPLKRSSVPGGVSPAAVAQRWNNLSADVRDNRRDSGRF